ncbi:hypothetical protein ACFFP0_09305 [Rhizobium puerariae]|uniref:Lipoyl-binding domain-containing protein n=1 Tax=Rhizobium puerariae TaxID=1585791 RepID=A0ABV6AGQ0_9HYPH
MKKRSHSISRYSEPDIIAELTAHLGRCNVSTIEIQTADGELKIVAPVRAQDAAAMRNTTALPVQEGTILARAPIAGVFLASHPLRPAKASQQGVAVGQGEVVGFVKIGPMLAPVLAEKAGTVGAIVAEPETLVGYGSPLLKTKA